LQRLENKGKPTELRTEIVKQLRYAACSHFPTVVVCEAVQSNQTIRSELRAYYDALLYMM